MYSHEVAIFMDWIGILNFYTFPDFSAFVCPLLAKRKSLSESSTCAALCCIHVDVPNGACCVFNFCDIGWDSKIYKDILR